MTAELTVVGRADAVFRGLPAREGPLTVGQRNVLQWLGRAGTGAIGVNHWSFAIPPGLTVDHARTVFVTLLARHESLRTTFELAGEPRQRVAGDGRLSIDVVIGGTGDDEPADLARLTTRLRAEPFDPARELPLRVALLVRGGLVRAGVMVYSHLALDIGGAALIGRDFTALAADLTAALPSEDAWQPLDRAAWEGSEPGQRRLAAALAYWQRQLLTTPHCMYAVPPSPVPRSGEWNPPEAGAAARRAPAFELKSPAAAIAVPHIAARTGASPTTVVVAAFLAVLAHRTGQRRCAYVGLVGNRIGHHLRGYVGTLAGPSLVVVEADTPGFDELVRRTGVATLAAARHATVDVGALAELSQEVYHQRGVAYARDVVVNNIHHALGNSAPGAPRAPLSALATAERTTGEWTRWERVPQLLNFRIFRLDETALTFRLATASARWVPPTDLESMARGVESLLLAAAGADVDLAELSAITTVLPAVRGPSWRHVDGCWVDLDQVRRLVADALAPVRTSVFYETAPDGSDRLVAYLAGGTHDVAAAHARCVAALPGPVSLEYHAFTTIAPSRYVCCATAPADPGDEAAWRRLPVLAQGDGRTG